MSATRRRWYGDARGAGAGSGGTLASDLARLAAEMDDAAWLTEEPLVHLAPGLSAWAAAHSDRWRLIATADDGHVLRIEAEWIGPGDSMRDLRADAFALLGSVVEGATYVEQRVGGDVVIFDVATGQHEGEMRAHGHLVSLRVTVSVGGNAPGAINART